MITSFKPNILAALCMAAIAEGDAAASMAPAPIPLGKATSSEFVFHFRTDKIRDDEGKVIGTGRKHPEVKAILPIPTYQQLIELLQGGGKEAEVVLDAVMGMINAAAREQIDNWRDVNGLDKDFAATAFDLSKLSLTAIANTPKAARAGATISDEDLTSFLDDYQHTMATKVGYDAGRVKLHVTHMKVLFRRMKNDKISLAKMIELLNVWATKTDALDDHSEVMADLLKRATKYLNAEEKDLAAAL